ncbi:glutamine--fructose-6-phosphate transaminase [Candidatus Kryptonium thompsonii]|uniref:Glutamine--fructose-6-phosphate aminotransferase [isomerizing] n=1 Tax=Candidatus Kryptonium thompsonii TaxID=1633631 RepID=A0A0N7MUB9_9BACT|nr:glutamine--fructose-6-phosphate transaminase (isomerizing) [Candidatus Kryptonium thompsoni]CUS76492.1 glutamine--fructose-6-phosphate transaminase [Candidatus Kryptonium thompsoni]CUS76567.1 glutamine--fructose-6-phosphate transaminase [Candidatus Kryptonium thompsoni]CUS76731.1 glutamine--fructose-6-phosphate transaminase [Candidatus Kryptonium thompsoni]CUS82696.1 glutamine--fructose-6-phosphate transaminase [Candidatus Kryptonium thompsoni]CUS83972.1 glutamine--fructose-6-phosphate tran
MCGIVGYIGKRNTIDVLINGLKRLEYRGYDSAGIAILKDGNLWLYKRAGKVATLESELKNFSFSSTSNFNVGISHTRWATHGEPNDINAHPHVDCTGKFAVVHNGIIENYSTLKKKLESLGHIFKSQTDTEVISHLIEEFYKNTKDFITSVQIALKHIEGTYGLAIICADEPEKMIVARKGSPIIIGLGDGEYITASDPSAIVALTRNVIYLEDDEIGIISSSGIEIKKIHSTSDNEIANLDGRIHELTFSLEEIEKGGFPHFMLKEIFEQPESLYNSMRGRVNENGDVKLGGIADVMDKILNARRFIITACGTSWHAGLVGKYMLEQYAEIPVDVEYASEFRYRNPVIFPDDVVWLISQSGETADTLAALRLAKAKGATTLGIVNVVGSTIARESQAGIYIHAGPEIGVASTKAFTSQLVVLSLITLLLGKERKTISQEFAREIAKELLSIPEKVKKILELNDYIKLLAEKYKDHHNFLYLGRGFNYPVALEGALKLKEISYIHAEGYPAAEMKHGPIALIDENMPVVFIAVKDNVYEKVLSNMEEVKARKGKIISIVTEIDDKVKKLSDHIIQIPGTLDMLMPILSVIPLQLLAYHIAVMRGCDVDQPRNLAKSVTVE